VSKSDQVFIGESNGYIRIFNFDNGNLSFQNLVTHPDLDRDAILSIQIVDRHMFVQCSDNIIRRFQLSGNKLHEDKKYAGGQFENLLLNAKISPDSKYLLAPSESGKPVLWDVIKGVTIDIDNLNLNINGPLTSCDWHPKYNLVAFGGFVEDCPVFVYGNMLSEVEVKLVTAN
jgi:WD40 repeat protein